MGYAKIEKNEIIDQGMKHMENYFSQLDTFKYNLSTMLSKSQKTQKLLIGY